MTPLTGHGPNARFFLVRIEREHNSAYYFWMHIFYTVSSVKNDFNHLAINSSPLYFPWFSSSTSSLLPCTNKMSGPWLLCQENHRFGSLKPIGVVLDSGGKEWRYLLDPTRLVEDSDDLKHSREPLPGEIEKHNVYTSGIVSRSSQVIGG